MSIDTNTLLEKRGIMAEEVDPDRQGIVEEVGDKRRRQKL